MKKILFVIALGAAMAGCAEKNYEKTEKGVVVRFDESAEGTRLLRLEAVDENIIRVTAAPADSFSSKESLAALQSDETPAWEVEEINGKLILRTGETEAHLSLETAGLIFLDAAGDTLLKEDGPVARTFEPVSVEGNKMFSVRQVFDSPDDEAFYGLGQHQNRQMNYKGEDVELAQHNIAAVVPFLYSSKNYGILWDNYSITRFGDPRPYGQLSGLQLYDKNGNPGGLTAQYFSGEKLLEEKAVKEIDHQYLEHKPMPPNYEAPEGRVVYEGSFSSEKEGAHKFLLYASGYFKLWIDDQLIMDKWRQGWNPWYNKFTVDMKKGERRRIRLEWDLAGAPYLALQHLDPYDAAEQNKLSLWSEAAHEIDYYFIKGADADEVIGGYRRLTGKAPVMPKWALGFWQSRERYRSQEELLAVVREFRQRRIPLDNIVLDWQYWEDDKWGSHEFDSARFPDPEGMVDELHNELNTRIMISVWPKFYTNTGHYREMNEKGYLYPRNVEKGRKDWVGPGYTSTFYDALNPGARKLFWSQLEDHLFPLGIDAWWMDATEPDIHSNLSVEERKLNMSPTYLGPGAAYFNAYSLMNAKGIYEGQRAADPDRRVFILTRSAFAGQQRYAAATWSGDIVARWSDLADQVPAGINFSMSGIPYWTSDIGGFSVEPRFENASGEDLQEWRELNVRWYQFGAFSPLFRAHGQYPYREIYNIAPEGHTAYETMLRYNKLRYRLMPYLYTLAGKVYHDDYTIMRGLPMDFAADKNTADIGDQYMFGPALLVNPVVEHKATSREVYLPAGAGWYDLYAGAFYEGGQTIEADAPYEKIPVFVKSGSIVPFGPELQYSTEKAADTITLVVYAGADGAFDLYEDDGLTYNYEEGKFSTIPIRYDDGSKSLTIGERSGAFDEALQSRVFNVIRISPEKPGGIQNLDSRPGLAITYDGREQKFAIE